MTAVSRANVLLRMVDLKTELAKDDVSLERIESCEGRIGSGWDTGLEREAKTLLQLADDYQSATGDSATAKNLRDEALEIAVLSGKLKVIYNHKISLGAGWGEGLDSSLSALATAIAHLAESSCA